MDNKKYVSLAEMCEILNVPVDTSKVESYIKCPVCGETHGSNPRKTMGLNFQKDVFHCCKCNVTGIAIDFYGLLNNCYHPENRKETAKSFYDYMKGSNKDLQTVRQKIKETPVTKNQELQNPDVLHHTYSTLLQMLSLSPVHKEHLIKKRGLSPEFIEKIGFKTYPLANYEKLTTNLQNQGCAVQGVPGFYKKNGIWTMVHNIRGFLIPNRDVKGRIIGFQIRADRGEPKYFALSSGKYNEGTYAKSGYAFYSGNSRVIYTEGGLKGAIIHYLTGSTVISSMGVNSYAQTKEALDYVRSRGCDCINLAYDMDYKSNEHVMQALCNLRRYINESKMSVRQVVWDENYKGLDDFLLEGRN